MGSLIDRATPPEPADHDHDRAIAVEDYKANIAEAAERLKFQVDYSQAALRNLSLVNGGAIVALLTFIGNTDADFNARAIWYAFGWFSGGLSCSLLAYFGAFFSQLFFMSQTMHQAWNAQERAVGREEKYEIESDYNFGNVAMYGAVVLALLSCIFFVIGAFVSLGGLA